MKKITLLLIVIATFTVASAQKNVLQVNPAGLVFGDFDMSYERVLSEKQSINLYLGYAYTKIKVNNDDDVAKGLGLGAGYKIYLVNPNKAPISWYLEPGLGCSFGKYDDDKSKEGETTSFNAGLLGGYQFIFGGKEKGVALDLGLGIEYVTVAASGDIKASKDDSFVPSLRIALGYAF